MHINGALNSVCVSCAHSIQTVHGVTQLAVMCPLLAAGKVSVGYIYSSRSQDPTGQCGLQLAGVWVTRSLKYKLRESLQWHWDELTRCTFLFSLPKTLLAPNRVFALMPLADARALLRRGELDVLHILHYKYHCDIYCTRQDSGAKGSYILLSLFVGAVQSPMSCIVEIMWNDMGKQEKTKWSEWHQNQKWESTSYKLTDLMARFRLKVEFKQTADSTWLYFYF